MARIRLNRCFQLAMLFQSIGSIFIKASYVVFTGFRGLQQSAHADAGGLRRLNRAQRRRGIAFRSALNKMNKSLQLFMTETDEANLSKLIRMIFPSVLFIDNQIWGSTQPPVKRSIQECSSGFAYIWNPEIITKLSYINMPDGRFRGPASGVVIQFIRSCKTSTDMFEDVLLSGSIGTGYDPSTIEGAKMDEFSNSVWKIIKQVAKSKAVPVSPFSRELIGKPDPKIRIGDSAAIWAHDGNILKYRSTENYYLPEI